MRNNYPVTSVLLSINISVYIVLSIIAWNGIEKILKYGISNINDPDFEPRTRWPLDPMAKPIRNAKEPR